MAHLLRLIALVLLFGVSNAHALLTTETQWRWQTNGETFGPWTTNRAACDGAHANMTANGATFTPPRTYTEVHCTDTQWRGSRNSDGVIYNTTLVKRSGACPANSTAVAGGCQCAATFTENTATNSCIAPPTSAEKWKKWCEDAAGQNLGPMTVQGRLSGFSCMGEINIVGSPIETPGYSSGDLPPNAGCTFIMKDRVSFQDPSGDWHTQGTGSVAGGTCITGDNPIPPDSPEDTENQPPGSKDPCPNGAPGAVNGQTVCAQHDPNAGIDWTGSSRVTNSDGSSVETERSTACVGGKCTTTTTTTTRDASNVVTNVSNTTNVESIGDTCKKDPGGKGCTGTGLSEGGGGEFGGSCAQGFKAESEDPVVAAMALEQHKRNCILFETETEERTAYEADKVKGKAGTDQTGDLPGNKSVNVSELDLQGTSLINVSSCITDKTITVVGRSVTLPFSRVCEFLSWLGTILVAIAYLIAARIVVRG